jgi:hypothetical protein
MLLNTSSAVLPIIGVDSGRTDAPGSLQTVFAIGNEKTIFAALHCFSPARYFLNRGD